MDELKRIEGKTIKDIKQHNDGANSSLIIKFEDGSKVNLGAFPNGDKGTGQLDISVSKIKTSELIGQTISKVIEEFDGEYDFVTILFKSNGVLKVSAFCSSDEGTANLNIAVHASESLVKESIETYLDDTLYEYVDENGKIIE